MKDDLEHYKEKGTPLLNAGTSKKEVSTIQCGARYQEKTCILYYHGSDWGETPSRQTYLMQAMSRYCHVVYLDKGRDQRGKVVWRSISDRLTVVRGLIRLFEFFDRTKLSWVSGMYARLALRTIHERYSNVIFWNAENLIRPYRFIAHSVLVFDSMDPCFSEDLDEIAAFRARDEEVLEAADVVFATADALADECRKTHASVTLLNNACEPEEYSDTLLAVAEKPQWWPKTEAPIGAYLGTLDYRFDVDLIVEACVQNPNVHFILAGHVVPGTKSESTLPKLLAMPNVTMPGRISVEDGRYLLAHCNFGLIPFIPGEMNDAVNPVKMYAYSLLGKPILGTAIRELVIRPEIVQVAPDAATFGRMVPDVVSLSQDPGHRKLLQTFALNNVWAVRAETAWNVLQAKLTNSACSRTQS